MAERRLPAIVIALALLLPVVAARGDDNPPKPKPKPKLELLTETQQAALDKRAIKIGVQSEHGEEVRVKATLTVGGIPDPYVFTLKPQSRPLRGGNATVRMKLSSRQREVLAFAEQACMGARVDGQGKVGKRIGELSANLRRDC